MDSARCRMGVAGLPQSPQTSPVTRGEHITQAGRDFSDLATSAQYMRDCMTAQGWTLR